MIEPHDFVSSGKSMIGESETGNRNAVSRIYYGVYHTGLLFARAHLGFTYDAGYSMHKQLILFFKTSNDRKLKVIGRQIEKLRNSRNEADYFLESHVSPEDAREDLKLALQTIAQIEQMKAQYL
jgi:hypothetical protein